MSSTEQQTSSTNQGYLITAAVALGSLLIVGPLVFISVSYALLTSFEAVGDLVGIGESAAESIAILGILCALVLSYTTAMEVARIRLHGFEELNRGSRLRRTVRHGLLTVVCLAALAVVGRLLYDGLLHGIGQGDAVILVLAVAAACALMWVIVRSARAFVLGTRDASS